MLRRMLFLVRSVAGSTTRNCTAEAWGYFIIAGLVSNYAFTQVVFAADDNGAQAWRVDFEKAEAEAKVQNVPLVIHFHAHWCGPCQTMESEVLQTAEVHAALRSGIVGVKIDADNRRDLVSRFGISALPTDVIVSSSGQILSKNVGSPGRNAYVARLSQFRAAPKTPERNSETAIVRAVDRSEKTPVTQVSQQTTEAASDSSLAVESEIVAVDGSPADGDVASTDKSAAAEVAASNANDRARAMTKALRRESNTRIGLHGYSPVSLTETETWKTGEAQYQHEFQGVCYQLSSAEELDRFKASPEKFAPALHGCDPVALINDQVVQAGHIELGVTWRSKVYFFYSKETRDKFLSNPERFVRTNHLTFFSGET